MPTFEQFDAEALKKADEKAGGLELAPLDEAPEAAQAKVVSEAAPVEPPTGEALDIRAEPRETRTTEIPPTSAWGRGWQKFSEGTKKFLKAAYEKVTSSEPVQNAMDRIRILREDVEARFVEPRLQGSQQKESARAAEAKRFDEAAQAEEERLKKLQEQMTSLGMTVSEEHVRMAQGEIAEQRKLADEARGKGGVQSIESGRLQAEFREHQAKREAAMKRINDRVEAKQEANREAIEKLRLKEKDVMDAKLKLEAVSRELLTAGGQLAQEIPKLKGASKELYEKSLKQISQKTREHAATLKKLGAQLKDIQDEIRDLGDRNRNLEAHKVGQEKREPQAEASVPEGAPQPSAPAAEAQVTAPPEAPAPAPAAARPARPSMMAME